MKLMAAGAVVYVVASLTVFMAGATGVPGFRHYPSLDQVLIHLPGEVQGWVLNGFPLVQ